MVTVALGVVVADRIVVAAVGDIVEVDVALIGSSAKEKLGLGVPLNQ